MLTRYIPHFGPFAKETQGVPRGKRVVYCSPLEAAKHAILILQPVNSGGLNMMSGALTVRGEHEGPSVPAFGLY